MSDHHHPVHQSTGRPYGLLIGLLVTALAMSLQTVHAQSGGWDGTSNVGNTGTVDHGNGVIQLLGTDPTGCAATALHRMNAFDLNGGQPFQACYQTFFGCPGGDVIGADTKGDGMAFSFWTGTQAEYNMNDGACGGGLGYHHARPQMVTIEFDTYSSQGLNGHDPNYEGTNIEDQVALHIDGESQSFGKISGTNPGNLEDGLEHEVCITMDPGTNVLQMTIDGVDRMTYDFTGTAYEFANYFTTNQLNITWSSGKFGATNPTTVTDGADISKNVGALCEVPLADIDASALEFCPGEDVRLSAFAQDPTWEYEWFRNGQSLGPATVGDTFRIVNEGGTYSVMLDNGQGSATSPDLVITELTNPDMTATDPAAVCGNQAVDITGSWTDNEGATAGQGTVTYWADQAMTTAIDGSNITQTGTYYINKDANGCQDMTEVDVTINATPDLTATNPAAVCGNQAVDITTSWTDQEAATDGQGTVTYWSDQAMTTAVDGANIAASGTYYIHKDFNGCEDQTQVDVTISPTPDMTAVDPAEVCDDQTVDITGTWTDNEAATAGNNAVQYWADQGMTQELTAQEAAALDASGTYYISKEVDGCTDVTEVDVTINPTPILSATDPAAVEAPQTVDITTSWQDDNPATAAVAVTYWLDDAATNPVADATQIDQSGVYYIQKLTPAGCVDIVPVTVVIQRPVPELVGGAAEGCPPFAADLTTLWQDLNATDGTVAYFSDQALTQAVADPTNVGQAGTYYVEKTTVSGSDVAEITVTILPEPALSNNGQISVCASETVDITPTPAVWQDDNPLTDGQGDVTFWADAAMTAEPIAGTDIDQSGTYYVLKTVNGCTGSTTVEVVLNAAPDLAITDPTPVCEPDDVDITDTWNDLEPTTVGNMDVQYWTEVEMQNELTAGQAAAIAVNGTFYISKTVNGCTDVEAVTTTINPTPQLTTTDPATVEAPATVDITNSWTDNNPGTDPGTATYWEDEAGTIAIADPTQIDVAGIYYIQKTTPDGCTDIQPVTVTISRPVPDLVGEDVAGCAPLTVDLTNQWTDLNAADGPVTYFLDENLTQAVADPTAVTESGTYYVQKTTASGFDVEDIVVDIYPQPDLVSNSPQQVCAPGTVDITNTPGVWEDLNPASANLGAVTYWLDADLTAVMTAQEANNIAQTGRYYILKVTDDGCLDTTSVQVNVSDQLAITVDPATICEGESAPLQAAGATYYTWTPAAGLNVTDQAAVIATPTISTAYTVTGSDDSGCTGEVEVIVGVNPIPDVQASGATICQGAEAAIAVTGADTYYWTELDTDQDVVLTSPDATTIYNVIGTTAAGCSAEDTAMVLVQDLPVLEVSPSTEICENSEVELSAAGADAINWAPSVGLSDSDQPVVMAAPTETTEYTVIGTTNGCSSIATVTVTVNPFPQIAVDPDVAICAGQSVELNATLSGTYNWSPADGLNTTVGPTVIVAPDATTTYSVAGTSPGCEDTVRAEVTVTVNPLPVFELSDTAVCEGAEVPLRVRGVLAEYFWSPSLFLDQTEGTEVNAAPERDVEYMVTATDANNCSAEQTMLLTVLKLPVVELVGDTLCEGLTATLQASGGVNYLWNNDPAVSDQNQYDVTPAATTTYSVTGIDENQCQSTASATVVVVPQVDAEAYGHATICPGTSTWLEVTGNYSFLWSDGQTASQISVSPAATQQYYVTISNSECSTVDSVEVTVRPNALTAYVPNAFTPDQDNVNDVFSVVVDADAEVEEFDAAIYNRWGDKIASWDNMEAFWDGQHRGVIATPDVYTYLVRIRDICNNQFSDMGKVTLLR